MTKREVLKRIEGLDEGHARSVVCALIGHSRVQDQFWGEWTCHRCDARLGDSLAGCYDASDVVLMDHHCDQCRAAIAKLTWKDTLLLDEEALDYLAMLKDTKASKRRQEELIAEREQMLAQYR